MANDCYGLDNATDILDKKITEKEKSTRGSELSTGRTQTPTDNRGKSLLESDLSTVRKLQEMEKTATGTERNAIKDEIRSHYADQK